MSGLVKRLGEIERLKQEDQKRCKVYEISLNDVRQLVTDDLRKWAENQRCAGPFNEYGAWDIFLSKVNDYEKDRKVLKCWENDDADKC